MVEVVGHVTTLPSLFNAAAAPSEPRISIFTETTPEVRFDATELEFPRRDDPHVTRLPLLFNAAKELTLEKISTTFVKTTEEEFPPPPLTPHVITVPSLFNAANTPVLAYISTTPEVKLLATEGDVPPTV